MQGCGTFSQTVVNVSEALGGGSFDGAQLSTWKQPAPAAPRIAVQTPPPGTPEGPYQTQDSRGRTLKSVVRNGRLDDFADVYHPNGRLHSHTPLVNGLAQGWSDGYDENGRLRSRIFYQNGTATCWERYDAQGRKSEGRFAP